MAECKVIITQDELDRMLTVVSNVHKDNDENERGATPADLPLSQADLDSLYKKGIAAEKAVGQAAGKKTAEQAAAAKDDFIRLDKPQPGKDDAARIRAQKIAERKAHSAQILAQVKADTPRRILVSYGGCLKKDSDIEKLGRGDVIRLDRRISENVKVYVDGRFFAEGEMGQNAGTATVRLTKLVAEEGQ